MTVTILQGFIALFGIIIAAFCAYGAFVPDKLSGSMKTAVQQSWAIYFAAGVRVVLGVILSPSRMQPARPWCSKDSVGSSSWLQYSSRYLGEPASRD